MKRDSFKSVRNKALKNGGHLSPPVGGDNAPDSMKVAAQARLEANLGKSPFATSAGKNFNPNKPPADTSAKAKAKAVAGAKPTHKKAKW